MVPLYVCMKIGAYLKSSIEPISDDFACG